MFFLMQTVWAELPTLEQSKKAYTEYEEKLQQDFVQEMQERELGDLTPGYLDRFIYKPVPSHGSEHEGFDAPEGKALYANVLGISYFPIYIEGKDFRTEIIDPIPHNKIGRAYSNPDWWFVHGRKFQKRIRIQRRHKRNDTVQFELRLGVEPLKEMKGDFTLQTMDIPKKSNIAVERFAKLIIDELVIHDVRAFTFLNSSALKYQDLSAQIVRRVEQYFEEMPTQAPGVNFRDNHHSFSFRFEVFWDGKKLWIRNNPHFTKRKDAWMAIPSRYLPKINKIKALSADGVALMLVDENKTLWRSGEFFTAPKYWKWHKNMGWLGLPLLSANEMKVEDALMWDVTDASLRVNLFEDDLKANRHPFLPGPDGEPGGIAQIYALSEDRRTIYSNDFWVSTDWRRISCAPKRNNVQVQSLSSSGSTMFVLTDEGELWTRYWNYNTSGASAPTNLYTLDAKQAAPGNFLTTRFLPTESWFLQPAITGYHTDRITILSTGHAGNHARLLRVEGTQNGTSGYFEKLIYEKEWKFIATGERLRGKAFLAQSQTQLSSQERSYSGTFGPFQFRVHNFHLDCSPSYLEIISGDVSVFLTLHTALDSPISSKKGNHYRQEGEINTYRVYLELPESYLHSSNDDPDLRAILTFLRNNWVNQDERYYWGVLRGNEKELCWKPKKKWHAIFSPGKGLFTVEESSKGEN